MDLLSGGSVGSGVGVVAGVVGTSMQERKVEDLNLWYKLYKECFITTRMNNFEDFPYISYISISIQ